jgi:hypothetical protein
MDINQKRLIKLLRNTDDRFEEYRQHPRSVDYADAYEQAKIELDEYLVQMRQSVSLPK